MRLTPLATALALLIVGCGLDSATAPDDSGPLLPEPAFVRRSRPSPPPR